MKEQMNEETWESFVKVTCLESMWPVVGEAGLELVNGSSLL